MQMKFGWMLNRANILKQSKLTVVNFIIKQSLPFKLSVNV